MNTTNYFYIFLFLNMKLTILEMYPGIIVLKKWSRMSQQKKKKYNWEITCWAMNHALQQTSLFNEIVFIVTKHQCQTIRCIPSTWPGFKPCKMSTSYISNWLLSIFRIWRSFLLLGSTKYDPQDTYSFRWYFLSL